MGTVYWEQDSDKKRICLRFSDGSESAYCHSKFQAFNLVIIEKEYGNLTAEEGMILLQDLKDFSYLPNEHIDLTLINLWLEQSAPVKNFSFDFCTDCNHCRNTSKKNIHGYFSYEEISPNDGQKKLLIKIDYLVQTKEQAYLVVKLMFDYYFIESDDADAILQYIEQTKLPDSSDRISFPKPSMN